MRRRKSAPAARAYSTIGIAFWECFGSLSPKYPNLGNKEHMGNRHQTALPRSVGLIAAGLIPALAVLGQTSITSVVTTDVATSSTVRNGLLGFSNAPFPGASTYDITYNGLETRVTSFVAGGDLYVPDVVNVGVAYVRRNSAVPNPGAFLNQDQTTAWNQVVTGNANTPAHTVQGQYLNTMDALFTSRNIRSGTENLFVNQGDPDNTSSNVERVDYVFGSSFLADSLTGFSVFERGRGADTPFNGSNGGFKVAAILEVDALGVPTSFGSTVLHITDNSYNNGSDGVGSPSFSYDVFSGNPDLDAVSNVAIGPQGLAGVLIKATDLVPEGTPIIGYAIFGEDVTGSGASLLDWDDTDFYPQNSTTANDMDMVASGAVRYTTTEVPEASTTAAMVALGAMVGGSLLRRRMARK